MYQRVQANVKDPAKILLRRGQIVEASVRLFKQKGFHKTTTREIARESGLSTGALYEYVKSKEDVLFLVCQHIHQNVHERLAIVRISDETAAGQLRYTISAFFDVMADLQSEILLIYQESKSLPHVYLRDVLHEEARIVQLFEDLLRKGIRDHSIPVTEKEVKLLASDMVVAGQMWAFRGWALRDLSFEEFRDTQVRLLLRACGL